TIDQFRFAQDDFEWMFEFVKDKAGNSKYSDSAVKRIFSKYMSNLVFVWKNKKDEVVGFAPVMETEKSIYYWLGFYKSKKYVSGLGTRMMYEALQWARDNDKEFAYLGTVYTNASLYKLNFDGWEFYNGFEWSDNKEQLKFLIGRSETNDPELLKDDEFVKRFYEGDTSKVLKVEKN
ncbi:GNAT family N-acetyltransferase, partial [candidate division WWE3 bacterium]|nr:GNAT family N-acetyltransferase [candidate division WWE3 bacterium]